MILGIFLLLTSGRAGAEERGREAVEMEPVVVTATGTEVPVKETTQSVTVITDKQIQERQAVRVEEILRYVPGVNLTQTGSRGAITGLYLRGGNTNHTQVLFNGVRINDAGGDFDFNALTTDNLDRIEVVRGPMSALYGADAMTGVVNLIPLKGAGPPTLNLAAGVGPRVENGRLIEEYRASLVGSYKKFGFSIGYSNIYDPGILIINNHFRNHTLVGRLDLDLRDNLSFTYTGFYVNSWFGVPTENGGDVYDAKSRGGPGLDPDQHNKKQDVLHALSVDYRPFKWWQNQLTLAVSQRDRRFDDPANPPINNYELFYNPYVSTFDGLFGSYNSRDLETRYSLDYRSNFRFSFRDKMESISTVGFYAREEQLKQWIWTGGVPPYFWPWERPTLDFLKTRRGATAVYGQEQLTLWNRLFLVGGFRVENSSVFDHSEFIPRASAAFLFPQTNTTIRAAGGRAIKEPTFLQSFSRSQLSQANPNLKPEKNVSWEVGLDQSLFDNQALVSLTYFENYFSDFITFVPRDYPQLSGWDNIGEVRVAGLESSVRLKPAKGLTLTLAYTNLFTRVVDDGNINNLFFQAGKPLLRRPRHTFSFVANYTRDRLNVNLSGLYTGWRDDSQFTYAYPFSFQSKRVDNFDFLVLNLAATYDLVRDWGYVNKLQLWARFNNILDNRYQEIYGYSSPGFSMVGGVRLVFGLTPRAGDKPKESSALIPEKGRHSKRWLVTEPEGGRI
ncbi:MAG: TonB-dependent receptor plug domain-containing protein [Desulfobaccales bacterium]